MGKRNHLKKRKRKSGSPHSSTSSREITLAKDNAQQSAQVFKSAPWKTIGSLAILVMTFIGFWNDVFGLRERFFPPKKEAIILSAQSIDLGSGTKRAINNFLVRNTCEMDLYQVTIKLLLKSTVLSVTNDDICVEMVDVPKNMEMPIPGDLFNQVLVADHGFIISGRDFNDCPGLWVVINHLPPKGYASFRIRNQAFKILPPGEHSLSASVAFYTNALPSTFMFDDDAPGFSGPRSDEIGMKSAGPGRIRVLCSMHTALIDGAEIVTNAICLMKADKWEDAEKELTRAIRRNPSLGVAYANRACVFLRSGRVQDAYPDCLKATSLLPDDALAHANFALCLRFFGRNCEALTNYNRAIVLAGTNMPSLICERGSVLNDLNRPEEARKDFEQAIHAGYTNEKTYYGMGIAFLNEQSFSNAVIYLSMAIGKLPTMSEAHLGRGLAFEKLGLRELSNKDYLEAVRLNPSVTNKLKIIKK